MFDSRNRLDQDHNHNHAQNRLAVIPTLERLEADPHYAGRSIRIAFLDSGFYPHPDFIDRVIAFHDISDEDRSLGQIVTPRPIHWHGTQTVSACAGDGCLSNGIYRGVANEAELVLVKVSRNGRIGDGEIEEGLQWIIANREKYDIRILNISLGGDCDVPTPDSRINQMIEQIVAAGVVVTVAAGNSERRAAPPASSPAAITVGGFSDGNRYDRENYDLYHSSYGETADGYVKPELIAPAMYVAAPILPGTEDYETAEILSMLSTAPDYSFRALVEEFWGAAGLQEDALNMADDALRDIIEYSLHRRKIVANHYQHVDGTSFAAPIVASVIAQMLEANPNLRPAAVKNILVSTASRLSGHPAIRQGFGVLNARPAVTLAASEIHLTDIPNHPPKIVGPTIVFRFHDDAARTIYLSGDFNGWKERLAMTSSGDGLWEIKIPCQPPGEYRYKFLIDGHRWTEDPGHGFKEDDGFGGFNSILTIANQ